MRTLTIGKNLVANTATIIHTIPIGYYAKWNLLYVLNGTGSTKNITVQWYDASEDDTINILYEYSVSSKEFFKIDGGAYIVLEEGDYIEMTSEASSTFSIITTFEQEKKASVLSFQKGN